MVIDMRHVERIDSSGIVALLAAKRAVASDGDMIFTSMTTPVAEIFHLTKMDHIFRVAEDTSAAVSEVIKQGVSLR